MRQFCFYSWFFVIQMENEGFLTIIFFNRVTIDTQCSLTTDRNERQEITDWISHTNSVIKSVLKRYLIQKRRCMSPASPRNGAGDLFFFNSVLKSVYIGCCIYSGGVLYMYRIYCNTTRYLLVDMEWQSILTILLSAIKYLYIDWYVLIGLSGNVGAHKTLYVELKLGNGISPKLQRILLYMTIFLLFLDEFL